MTNDEMLFDAAALVVADARECALHLWAFHLSMAGRYQDHAHELLRILGGLREVDADEARVMRIVWERLVLDGVERWRANEG